MRAAELRGQLWDFEPEREIVVELMQPDVDMLISRGGLAAIKSVRLEGVRVVIELGEQIEEEA